MHRSNTIIFGTSVTEKVGNQNVLYFSTLPNLCFCITWGNRKHENCILSLKCCMLFTKNTRNTFKYHLITAKPPFTVKIIDRMHQTGPRILLSLTHMLYVNQVCHGVGRCVKDGWELFFVKPEWKSCKCKLRRYQTHHRWPCFVQEDSALVHCACSTVQLLQRYRLIQAFEWKNVIFCIPHFAR